MKTNFDYDEAEEARELSPEEARSLGLPVEKSPEEMLNEIEQALDNGMHEDDNEDEDDDFDEEEWERETLNAMRALPEEERYYADTHVHIDDLSTLSGEEMRDPEPEFAGEEPTEEEQELFDEWWKRRSERRHRVFVEEMIAHGNRRLAYQKAYPGVKDASARVNACRLLADSKIARAIRDGLVAKKREEELVVKAVYNGKLTALEEKRAILAKLIRGEIQLEREVAPNGTKTTLKQKPDFKDILRAIVVDNKMEEEWIKSIIIPDKGY